MTEHVGIFGGTFDPIHCGHLIIAADAQQALGLDKVLFVVAKRPYQKEHVTDSSIRYAMAIRAVRYLPWAKVSSVELERPGPTYTIDTVNHFERPGRQLHLLLGQDQFENRHTWQQWDEIASKVHVCVAPRWVGISSTDIRRRIREGRPIKHLVPDCVQIYIEEHSIYPKD